MDKPFDITQPNSLVQRNSALRPPFLGSPGKNDHAHFLFKKPLLIRSTHYYSHIFSAHWRPY